MWTRKGLKEDAKAIYKANYWVSVLAAVILVALTSSSGSSSSSNKEDIKEYINGNDTLTLAIIIGIISIVFLACLIAIAFNIFVGNLLVVGCQKVFIENKTEVEKPRVATIFSMFKSGSYGNLVLVMFLKGLFIFLWSLLLIIPGIVKAYEYRMIPYLLANDPSLSKDEAFAKSKEMMDGQKWDTFVLDLSFIGWFLLSALTFGILAIFFVNPYYYQTCANQYIALKGGNSTVEVE